MADPAFRHALHAVAGRHPSGTVLWYAAVLLDHLHGRTHDGESTWGPGRILMSLVDFKKCYPVEI